MGGVGRHRTATEGGLAPASPSPIEGVSIRAPSVGNVTAETAVSLGMQRTQTPDGDVTTDRFLQWKTRKSKTGKALS